MRTVDDRRVTAVDDDGPVVRAGTEQHGVVLRAHISTVRLCPGVTVALKRPDIVRRRAGSEPAISCSSARPVTPYVHRPCRIGRSNPARAANAGSACNGLRSPLSRYSSACSGRVG